MLEQTELTVLRHVAHIDNTVSVHCVMNVCHKDVLCASVEQESVGLGTDTRHSEIRHLFLQSNVLPIVDKSPTHFSRMSVRATTVNQLSNFS